MKKPLSLYFHIPYCVRKCNYCDFCSFLPATEEEKSAYAGELARRVRLQGERCRGYRVETVYFGGGTPTLLPTEGFAEILSAVRETFSLSETPEITSECNPGTADADRLRDLASLGVNRLSIGLQSSDGGELRALGRIHTAQDFDACYRAARQAGFGNLSVDLMFGIPGQTRESFRRSLRFVTERAPEHVSVYGLRIEPDTPFGQHPEELSLPDEDTEDSMYRDAVAFLSENGIFRYEISNFARPGAVSRHNYAYWTGDDYLGFGIAAHSYFGGVRTSGSRDYRAFLRGEDITDSSEVIAGQEAEDEYVMLRMRLEAGISPSAFDFRFGKEPGFFEKRYGSFFASLIPAGYVRRTEEGYAFTTAGFRVSNAILSEVLFSGETSS